MKRLYINPDYQGLLSDRGLSEFEQFVALADGAEQVAVDKGRATHRLPLGGRNFYLKTVHKPIIAPSIEALLSFRQPHHYCWRELQQVQALQAHHIPVMDVAAAGEAGSMGVLNFSFLLAPEVEGTFLDQLFADADGDEQLSLLGRLGSLVGQLHSGGFFAPVRMKDVIVDTAGQFVMIDRETRKPGARKFSRDRALSGLHRTLWRQSRDGIHWSDQEMHAHLEAYLEQLGDRLAMDEQELAGQLHQMLENTGK